MTAMKITAGLGSADDYAAYCRAGADECFCGYVPLAWAEKYGLLTPLNRREVSNYNVQLGAESELKIIQGMVQEYKRRVHLTFNSLYYTPEQYPVIAEIISRCMDLGFRSFILADPALMVYLREQNIMCEIHISGELGEINHLAAEAFLPLMPKRIIFPRKNTPSSMEDCIKALSSQGTSLEYEAFALNELCQFSGSFCNSFHCDELGYLCRTMYWLGNVDEHVDQMPKIPAVLEEPEEELREDDLPPLGITGCGLCALPELSAAGITHLKLVGRGNHTDCMVRDIRSLRLALDLLEESQDAVSYRTKMKSRLFVNDCPHSCYYL